MSNAYVREVYERRTFCPVWYNLVLTYIKQRRPLSHFRKIERLFGGDWIYDMATEGVTVKWTRQYQ